MSFLEELEKLITSNDIVEKEIFSEIIYTIKFVNNEGKELTKEQFVNILKDVIEDDSKYNTLVNNIQKNFIRNSIYEFTKQNMSTDRLETCVNIILQTNGYNFWKYKVNDVVNRIRKYFKIITPKEEVLYELEKLVVEDMFDEIMFDDIIAETEDMDSDTLHDKLGDYADDILDILKKYENKTNKLSILKLIEAKVGLFELDSTVALLEMGDGIYTEYVSNMATKIVENIPKLYETKTKSKN